MRGMVSIFKIPSLSPKFLERNIWYLGKKYPDPDQTKILIPNPTKKIL